MQISQASIEQAIKTVVVNASPPVIAAYLFGSHATGKVWSESDVDVALLFGETDASNQLEVIGRVSEYLCQALGDVEVDVVNLEGVATHFAYEILRTGKLAFCANPHERIQFEMGIFEKHTDEGPWQQIGRRYLMKRVKARQMLQKGKDMIDRRRVEHLVNYVQEMLNRLQSQGGKRFEEFAEDFQAVDASLYELQTMLEAISNIAMHVVTGANLGAPNSRPEAIEMLAKNGIIPQELAKKLAKLSGCGISLSITTLALIYIRFTISSRTISEILSISVPRSRTILIRCRGNPCSCPFGQVRDLPL